MKKSWECGSEDAQRMGEKVCLGVLIEDVCVLAANDARTQEAIVLC